MYEKLNPSYLAGELGHVPTKHVSRGVQLRSIGLPSRDSVSRVEGMGSDRGENVRVNHCVDAKNV